MISEKTLAARANASAVLVRFSVAQLTLAEAEHQLWKIINGLTDNYDQGYTAGYRAREEGAAQAEQQRREPRYDEL